jgi:environmental stress-induced protein Ves
MKIQHFKANQTKTITWASGTSTELFIHPSTGDFQKRDFLFRLSTATVEAEESVFSDFSGITRTLMLLKGNLTLIHEGRYTKELKPFDQDTFDGGWDTKSKGKVKDFNLMCKEGATGTLKHYHLQSQEQITLDSHTDYNFIYVENGSFQIGDEIVSSGGIAVFESKKFEEVTVKCNEEGNLIYVAILID